MVKFLHISEVSFESHGENKSYVIVAEQSNHRFSVFSHEGEADYSAPNPSLSFEKQKEAESFANYIAAKLAVF